MQLTGDNLIGFKTSQKSENKFQAVNPATLEELAVAFVEASREEVDQAVSKAHEAFTIYKNKTNTQRAEFLKAIADEIENLGDKLIERCSQETGLPEGRFRGERGRTVYQLRLFADLITEGSWVDATIETAIPDRTPIPKPDIRSMLLPLGPVGIFGASNFPLAFSVAGGDTASALAAGCPVVVKAHPAHPGTSELVGRAIIQAAKTTKMPEGVFSLLQGSGHEVGMHMVTHDKIKAIGFTGSLRGGKAIFDAAVRREEPIPVYAEMGSTNPVFILPGKLRADDGTLAKGMAGSITLGVGQFCTNPGLQVMIEDEDSKGYLEALKHEIQQAPTATMLTPGIHQAYNEGILGLTEISGVVEEARGSVEGNTAGRPYLLSTSIENVMNNPMIAQEVFGPSSVVVKAKNKKQILELARNLEGHLTATIHGTTEDLEEFKELIDILSEKVGRIVVNGYPTGVEVCHAMVHGGPFPATTDSRSTSVGTKAIERFARPVCFQGFPDVLLPDALKSQNPLNIMRKINGKYVLPMNQ